MQSMAEISAEDRLEPGEEFLPYRLREHFLTAPEIALYRALREIAQDRYIVFAKVALQEIFNIVRPNENVHYFNKLFRKHVDFLLCHPRSLGPQMGVELVRPVPASATRSTDQFMEDLFLAAGLPLVQVSPNDHYEIADVVCLFQGAIAKVQQVERRLSGISSDSVPMCPVCGKMMVLRTHRSGPLAGQLYYGCVDNPTCPGNVLVNTMVRPVLRPV
jgi:hypothetical protein